MLLWQILLNKWFWLVASVGISYLGLVKTLQMAHLFGKMGWAEKYLGEGGSYTVWKIIGVVAPIAAMIYAFSGLGDNAMEWVNAK
jgi:hypothetical protein